MQSTILDYLENTYLFKSNATLISISSDEKGLFAILDRTIFYPQGGGQPSDTGVFVIDGNNIDINFVRFFEGEVRHYGNFSNILLENKNVELIVNEERRKINAKAHTAGHLISNIVEKIDTSLIAIKGYHFTDGMYVEFKGNMPNDTTKFLSAINFLIKQNLSENKNIKTEFIVSKDGEYSNISQGKPLRLVTIDGYSPVPCGGTHVSNLSDIQSINALKIKNNKGFVKISYIIS